MSHQYKHQLTEV